jgi:hypothetical protein
VSLSKISCAKKNRMGYAKKGEKKIFHAKRHEKKKYMPKSMKKKTKGKERKIR